MTPSGSHFPAVISLPGPLPLGIAHEGDRYGLLPKRVPDHGQALIWAGYPLTISQVIHDVKKVSAHKLQPGTDDPGSAVAASILGPVRAECG
ncbi:MAG: hypothetical protein ACRD3T_13130 [Terriglobia bacterium]